MCFKGGHVFPQSGSDLWELMNGSPLDKGDQLEEMVKTIHTPTRVSIEGRVAVSDGGKHGHVRITSYLYIPAAPEHKSNKIPCASNVPFRYYKGIITLTTF